MPENSTTDLVKTAQSPVLARVSNQLALTEKLLTKPEEPFLIPYKWSLDEIKMHIVLQEGMLFTENNSLYKNDTNSDPTYCVCFQRDVGINQVINNVNTIRYPRVYIKLTKIGLKHLLDQMELLVDDQPVADIHKIPESSWEKHLRIGFYRLATVVHEDLTPKYPNQLAAANLKSKQVYVDKDGKPVFRISRAYWIIGVIVRNGTGITIYDSEQDFNIFISNWDEQLTDEEPNKQALKKAIKIQEANPGSELVLLTEDHTGRIEIPKTKLIIAGACTMADDEFLIRVEANQ